MNITKMKWIAAVVPAICIGLFEFVRHEFLHVISMDLGNVMVAGLTGVLFLLYSHGIFALMENLYGKLQKEKEETAVLQERYRIARELHDNVAQALFFINVKAMEIETALLQQRHPLAQVKELRDAIKFTDADIRQHIFALQKVAQQTDINLPAAVREYLDQYDPQNTMNIALNIQGDINAKLSPHEKNQLFHIFQELLLNIRKHAEAKQVNIHLSENGQQFSMLIEDDGKGFPVENVNQKKSSFGFKILEDDIRSIGAELDLQSFPGKGTKVSVRLKLKEGNVTDDNQSSGGR